MHADVASWQRTAAETSSRFPCFLRYALQRRMLAYQFHIHRRLSMQR